MSDPVNETPVTWSVATHQTTSCSVCLRRRKCGRHGRWSHRCQECWWLEGDELKQARAEARKRSKERTDKAKLRYPAVGGPNHGEHFGGHAVGAPDGYKAFNRSSWRGAKRRGGLATMIWVWDPDDELRNR